MAQYAAQMLRHHQQSKPYSRRTPAAKPYSCDQCGRGFKYLHTLRFHVKTTHDSAAPAVEPRLSRLRRDNSASVPQNLSMGSAGNFNASPDEKSQSDADSREEDVPGRDGEPEQENREQLDVRASNPEADTQAAPAAAVSLKKEPVEQPSESYGQCQDAQERQPGPCGLSKMDIPVFPNPPPLLSSATDAWRNMKIQSEVPLVTKVEAVYPPTEQQYTFYKCGVCSEVCASIQTLCDHLQVHTRAVKEHHCDKCGAVFKWRSQLLVHEQVHQVVEGKGLSHVLGSLPEALIGEPRVSFDQALQLGALAGQQLLPGFLQHTAGLPNMGMSLPLALPGSTSVASSSSLMELSTPSSRSAASSKPACSSQECGASTSLRLPFQCSYCCKSFDRIFSLQRHERIHTGVKPCYCKACGRGFSERRNLRHHIIRFHSDVSQRDQLRRRRRAAAARSRNGNGGSPGGGVTGSGGGSHKLVSFLKKTAVRILNSMDQTKEESEEEDGTYEDDDAMGDEEDHEDGSDKDSDHFAEKARESDEQNSFHLPQERDPTKPEGEEKTDDGEEEDNKTIIYPLESGPADVAPQPEKEPPKEASGSSTTEVKSATVEETKKASTTANKRKKGKPVRYGAAVMLGSPSRDADMDAVDQGIKMEELREERAADECGETESADDGGHPYSEEEMAAWAQLGKQLGGNCENGDARGSAILKAQLRGHGSFFSSYNPRLGVVENPISRDEACKPHVGPDGKLVYPCSYCSKAFCSTSDLHRHMDFHEDVRPFKCPYCSYHSRTNSQLKVHMMRHCGIKQFLCHACNYNGVTQSDLNRHCKTRAHVLRTHNVCPHCGIGFHSRVLLEDHVRMFDHGSAGHYFAVDVTGDDCCTDDEDEIAEEANNNDCNFKTQNAPRDVEDAQTGDLSFEGRRLCADREQC